MKAIGALEEYYLLDAGEWIDHEYKGTFSEEPFVIYNAVWKQNEKKLILDYNYSGLSETFVLGVDADELPTLERRGYEFLGWYYDSKGEKPLIGISYFSLKDNTRLYARWVPVSFKIDYYDGITLQFIERVDVTADSLIKRPANINGMSMRGWTNELPGTASKYNQAWMWTEKYKLYAANTKAANLPYEDGIVKLYSCYNLNVNIGSDETALIYLANGGERAPQPQTFKDGEKMKIANFDMKKEGCTFAGWELLSNDVNLNKVFPYFKGEELKDYPAGYVSCIFAIARWTSNCKVTLDPGYGARVTKDLPYLPGEVIRTEDLPELDRPGFYIAGWETDDGTEYKRKGDGIKVPAKNITITPIWEELQCSIYCHWGFDVSVYKIFEASGITTLSFDTSKMGWVEPEGYTFVGWTLVDTLGEYWNVPSQLVITEANNERRILNGDLHVYSCYKEVDRPEGKLMVIYNAMGGEGGPGIEYYDLGKSFNVSTETPSKPGCTFLGWSEKRFEPTYEPDYRGGEIFTGDDTSGIVHLYAKWYSKPLNDWQYELQARFGREKLPDYKFMCEYESTEWEKMNDCCYIAIKTKKPSSADPLAAMESTVLIVEYRNGRWELTGRSASQQIRKMVEYEILTQNRDGEGWAYNLLAKAVFAVASKIPNLKTIIKVVDIYGIIADLCNSIQTKGLVDIANLKLTNKLALEVYKKLQMELGDDELVNKLMVKIVPVLSNNVIRMFETLTGDGNLTDLVIDRVKDLSKAIKAVESYNYELEMKEIQESFKTINADAKAKIVDSATKSLSEIEETKGIDFKTVLNNKYTVDILEIIWDLCLETARHELTKNPKADPSGEFNDALHYFYKEIPKLGFNSEISSTFYGTVDTIFEAYWSLK